jgi:hypothetical protein
MISCEVCGGQHPNPGQRCEYCAGCLRMCERTQSCSFVNQPNPIETIPEKSPIRQTRISVPKSIKIEDAIKCWMISSLSAKFPQLGSFSQEDVISLSKDLLEIMDEELSSVDPKFDYFVIKMDDGKKVVEEIDADNLFTNQTLDYILFLEQKRVNLGKKIAIMEKGDDTV